jgi:thiamine transport system permease protein
LIGLPLSGVLRDGAGSLASLAEPEIGQALVTSLAIGLAAACLACLIALSLANWRRRGGPVAALASGMAGLVSLTVPPFALVAGLFVLLRDMAASAWLAPTLVVLVNGLMALPWTLRQIEGSILSAQARHGRLCASLGVTGLDRLRLIDWPLLRRPFTIAFATAFCLSLGDLGVAAFFGSGDFVTLPLVVFQRLGAYRMDEAGAAALLLAGLILSVYLVAEWLAGPRAEADGN